MAITAQAQGNPSTAARFGTFTGVFVPNVLTILGLVLFLRIGWVVGQSGLWGALLIVFLANLISFLTGLSLSAISTSMNVKAGGKYYIISRSLGLEIGGAIGVPLYLSQAISVAFYVIGFTESLYAIEYFQQFDPRLISTGFVLLFGFIAYVGADFALRIQHLILAVLVASLISFFAGGWDSITAPLTEATYTDGFTFWTVFAIFFPAVTGIGVGASMSGDLREPSKSIPVGTMASIVVTAIIYLAAVVWFAFQTTDPLALINDDQAMQRIAVWPWLIFAGVWASTLSSALGSVLAAPRTLQAVAYDRVVPMWMASRLGSKTEPRMAVLITTAIATSVIWMGDLNFVAPVITMFFLNTYGIVNLAAAIEKLVGNPSFRPQFRVPWYISLLGALGCYGVMFLINSVATVVAIIISYGIYFYLQRQQMERTWGDVRSGIWLTLARFTLLRLEQQQDQHAKNWRPNLIVFTGQPHNRQQLVEVANWLSLGRGIVTFFQFIVGDVEQLAERGVRETAQKHIRSYIQRHNMLAFAEVEVVSDFSQGVLTLVQAHGIGGLESNTVLLGWSGTQSGQALQMGLLRSLVALHKSILFLNYVSERGFGQRQRINIWWQGRGGNGDLMLLLAHLICQHHSWRDAQIHLLRVVGAEVGVDDTRLHMQQLLKNARVEAEPVIIVSSNPIAQIIHENSMEADLTLLGMQIPEKDELLTYSKRLDELVQSVGSVLLVRSSQRYEDLLTPD